MGMMQQMFAGFPTTAGAPGVTTDALFKYVSLLLNSDNRTAFNADASTSNLLVNISGTTRNDIFSPLRTDGNYSNYFNGSSDYLSVPVNAAFAFGTGDFTVEAWVYQSTSAAMAILGTGDGASTNPYFYVNGVIPSIYYNSVAVATGPSIVLNTWTHVAFVRSSNNFMVYTNGVAGSGSNHTDSLTNGTAPRIGSSTIGTQFFAGYISNMRVVKGTAVYTSAFTPSTSPLTAITNTSLLTCQSASLKDNSTNNFAITVGGTPVVKPAIPFTYTDTSGSAYFNGSTDRLSIASNAAFAFGTSDYTVECWINPATLSVANARIIDRGDTVGNLIAETGAIVYYYSASKLTIPSGQARVGSWSHIAVVRSGTTLSIYFNGVLKDSITDSTNLGSTTINIGAHSTGVQLFTGNISNLRMVKGTAVYTSNFTPPTAPLTAITNTSLLTLQNPVPANNRGFIDSSANNRVLAPVGSPTQGTFSPFSKTGWSGLFNGTNQLVTVASSAAAGPGTVFTVEGWAYPTGFVTSENLVMGTVTGTIQIGHNGTAFGIASTGLGWRLTGATGLTLNQWNHFAIVRSGTGSNQTSVYINGVRTANGTVTDAFVTSSTVTIGATTASTYQFPGYLSNIRIVSGTAVYNPSLTTLTVPTSPLTAIAGTSLLTLQSNSFKDNSTNNLTITATNSPKVMPSSPFNPTESWSTSSVGGSVVFNGSTDYLSIPQTITMPFGASPFTVEFWVYKTNFAKVEYIYGTANATVFQLGINTTGTITYGPSGGSHVASTGTVKINEWTHVAVVRTSTAASGVAFYFNGVPGGTATDANNYPAGVMQIGTTAAGTTYCLSGYLSNLRTVSGTALYSGAFTPPTAPLSPTANTQLLLSGSNVGVQDASTNNDFISAGFVSGSMTQSKFGASAMYFNGTTSYVYAATPSSAYDFGTGNFTLEYWVYPLSGPVSTYNPAFYTQNSTGGAAWSSNGGFRMHHTNILFSDSTQLNYTSAITNNVWTHVALVRVGNTLTAYKNGVANGTKSHTIAIGSPLNQPALGISDTANAGGREFLNGYITDLRITKGVARYTSTFTPPSAAFPTR